MAESETSYLVKTLFIQGSYSACVATASSEGSQASISTRLYAARSLIASNETDQAADVLQSLPQEDLAVRTVTLLNEYIATQESVADELREILQEYGATGGEAPIVRPVAGALLHLEGETFEALAVLAAGNREHDQECVALQVQLLLALDNVEGARQIYDQAKSWADDSIVIQLCEAWIGLRTGGAAYQAAFYVFDEIAQLPSANNVTVLNGKAVAQACMGHWPEAESALQEAAQVTPHFAHTAANTAALAVPSGKAFTVADAAIAKLKSLDSNHSMLEDLAHKSGLFDEAASRFSPSVAVSA